VFQADVTVPDNTQFEVGERFVKTWCIRNTGSCKWGRGYNWTFIEGEQMGAPSSVAVPETRNGEDVEISVELVAPMDEGQYRGYWQMCVNETECFGDSVYVQIMVVGSPTLKPSDVTATEWEGVYTGMPADDVLRLHPREEMTGEPEQIGSDSEGLVVRWAYPSAYLTFARRYGECPEGVAGSECYCYRVVEIELR